MRLDEAFAALSALGILQETPGNHEPNPLKALVHVIALYLETTNFSCEEEKDKRRQFEMAWAESIFDLPNLEEIPPIAFALRYAKSKRQIAPYTAFEKLLFRLWPIVLHQKWDLKELSAFLRHAGVQLPLHSEIKLSTCQAGSEERRHRGRER